MRRLAFVALGVIALAEPALAHPDDDLDPDRPRGEFLTEDVYRDEIQHMRELAEAARPRAVRSFLRRAVGTWKCTGSSRGRLTLRRVGRSFVVTYAERGRRGSRIRVALDLDQAYVTPGGLVASATRPVMQLHTLHWHDADSLAYVVTAGEPETRMHDVTCVR